MRNRIAVLIFLLVLGVTVQGEALAKSSRRPGRKGQGVLTFVAGLPGQLYIATADGRRVRQITRGREYRSNPVWSPDGQQIVFERYTEAQLGSCGESELYTIRPDGSRETRVTDSGVGPVRCAGVSHSPTWSPDGRSLAFVVTRSVCYPYLGCLTQSDIYRVNRDGSGQLALTVDGLNWDPAWSPDGRRIAFVRGGQGGASAGTLWVMNTDGSGQSPIGPLDVVSSEPAWSPDGHHIAFFGWYNAPESPRLSFISDPAQSPLPSRIWVMDANGTNARHVTAPLYSSPGARAFQWSPDARWLVFADGDPFHDRAIQIVRSDGSGRRTITRQGSNWDPTWSPDGRRIAFVRSEDSGTTSIRVVDRNGSNEVAIGSFQYAALPTWSPRM